MEIIDLTITPEILDKLRWKHNVTETEVRQVFLDKPRYRFIEKGGYEGERYCQVFYANSFKGFILNGFHGF